MSAKSPDDPIYVTGHAIDRLRSRHRDFFLEKGIAAVVYEVARAIREGRRAKTQPRWISIEYRKKVSKGRHGDATPAWFVWDQDETRCYVVTRGDTRRGPGWIVKTVYRRVDRRSEAEEAA